MMPMPVFRLLILTAMALAISLASPGQTGSGRLQVEVTGEGLPLEWATVWLAGPYLGAVADEHGRVLFDKLPAGEIRIEASHAAYFGARKSLVLPEGGDTLVVIDLQPHQLEQVVVTGSMREVLRSDSPIPVDVVSSRLFLRNPAPNLFESAGMIAGVQPTLNCNVCYTGDIRIHGMDGVYTQVLIDGMPIVSGLGTVYGLMGIPNSMIDRIEIVRGPAGALYGSESMAGQINIITKDAAAAPAFSLDVMGTSWQEWSGDAGVRIRAGKNVSLLAGLNAFWFDIPVDHNGDGFTDAAIQRRISLFHKGQAQWPEGKTAQWGLRYVGENRWGGQTHWTPVHRGGSDVYGESILTRRWEVFGLVPLPLPLPVFVQASWNRHEQDSWYGDARYDALQQIAYAQVYADVVHGAHRWLTGAAFRHTLYDDNTPATAGPERTGLPGVFVQYEWEGPAHDHVLAGLRTDWHPHHGPVWSPRLAWHRHIGDRQDLRASLGSGFRVVHLFTEDHAALSGAREVVIAEDLKPERSWSGQVNYAWRWPATAFFLNLDGTAFYTWFSNRIVPDYDTDPHSIIYANLDGGAVSRGLTFQADYSDGLPLRLSAGVTWMDVYQRLADGTRIIQIRAPRWSGTLAVNWTHPGTRLAIDLTGNWYGPQRLPVVPQDFRPEWSPWFALLNVQVSRKSASGWEVYAGVKNLLDFVPVHPILRPHDPFDQQADDPVSNPHGYRFDPSYNYAPLQGIRGYAGVRWTLQGSP